MIPALDAGSITWVRVGVRVRPSTLLVRVDAGARRGVDDLVRVRVRVRATVVCCQRDLVGVRVSVR